MYICIYAYSFMAWLPTGIGILCIPLVPMLFDKPVEVKLLLSYIYMYVYYNIYMSVYWYVYSVYVYVYIARLHGLAPHRY